jgi:hypothetical protein
MLTRHFYRLDEVRAALAYSIMKGRVQEAAFWGQELVESEALREAWATVLETWLWHALVLDPAFLSDVFTSSEVFQSIEQLHLSVYRLAMVCREQRDNSLWALLVIGTQEGLPDRLCMRLPSYEADSTALQRYMVGSLFQGKALGAWWAATKLGLDDADRLLNPSPLPAILTSLRLDGEEWRPIGVCARILHQIATASTGSIASAPWTLPADLAGLLRAWSIQVGRRQRRLYAIPKECLYAQTERGILLSTQTTLGELRIIEPALSLSLFWSNRFRATDDEAIEAFYAAYFPDDIPDEWSLKDQEKSHGSGILRLSQGLELATLGRLWMTAESRYAWGFYEWSSGLDLQMELEPGCLLKHSDIGQLYGSTTGVDPVVEPLLEPIRKMLVVE